MKNFLASFWVLFLSQTFAQMNPAITNWMINTTGIKGRHYIKNNSTPIQDTASANVQLVQYSADFVYVSCSGIPAYVVGPYMDGNPSQAIHNNYTVKIPLKPQPAPSGSNTAVGLGVTGMLVNGVPIFNYSDARSYQNQGKWHQNAIVFENTGFDCAKGHPQQQGGYHHHQNPSAFNVAKVVNSNICNPYLADGLYIPDSTMHGPLIGYAFDGYPVYGGYGYSNANDPKSGFKRMIPSYQMRNISARTTLPDGTSAVGPAIGAAVPNGPGGSVTAVLGAYAEDFEFIQNSGDLDEHNGRFCVTPEYPNGTYCYFATIDANGNSVFPYVFGPTYYGVVPSTKTKVVITEKTTIYTPSNTGLVNPGASKMSVYPNPANDLLVVQCQSASTRNRTVTLLDMSGKEIATQILFQGSTMCYFDTQTIYPGYYILRIADLDQIYTEKVVIGR